MNKDKIKTLIKESVITHQDNIIKIPNNINSHLKPCCKKILKDIESMQKFRQDLLTIKIEVIEGKEGKTKYDDANIIVLLCYRAEAKHFLKLLKEMNK